MKTISNFIIQFPLQTQLYQDHILNKRFEIGRKIYNSLVSLTLKRYKEMIKTKKYRELLASLTGNKKKDKSIYKEIQLIRKEYGLTEFSFHSDVKKIQKHFKVNLDAFTSQKIATYLWKSYDKFFYGNGKAIHYKKYGNMNTLEGKTNGTGIRFIENQLQWNGLNIPIKINDQNLYEYQAMQSEISYCRIVRKFIKNNYKFYIQIVLKGKPPMKCNQETGEIKHSIGSGDVGLDIGTSTIAICSQTDVKLYELANKVQNIENKKRLLLRKMDRSKRSMNPNNFNPDGTIKKQGNQKVQWIKSKHYLNDQLQLKELYRKQADVRKYQHECLANEIISLGDNIFVETMNFKGLQRRAKKTEKNDKGKFKKKKRFGKSLANKAPAMLLTILDRKLRYYDKVLNKIDTYSVKASQYSHIDGTYKKKKLSQRWNEINGYKIQRDLYSAFLIMNVENDLKEVNQTKCKERFKTFLKLHELEVKRLTGQKNLRSIAI